MSFVEDFEEIAKDLKAKEAEGPKSPIVTDPNPPEYKYTLETIYPHGYLEAFKRANTMLADNQALRSKPTFPSLVDNSPILIVTGTDQFGEPITIKI